MARAAQNNARNLILPPIPHSYGNLASAVEDESLIEEEILASDAPPQPTATYSEVQHARLITENGTLRRTLEELQEWNSNLGSENTVLRHSLEELQSLVQQFQTKLDAVVGPSGRLAHVLEILIRK